MGEISISDTYKVLESALRPLSYWYNQDNVEEVAVDSPGGIWLRLRGRHAHPWHYYEDTKLTREFLNNNAITLDGDIVNDENLIISLSKKYHTIRRGKKKYYLIKTK